MAPPRVRGKTAGGLVAFLGPSLPASEARRLAPGCAVLPPARQGDVWRALVGRPAVIALVDGLFESTPSVWHHELLDAVDAGVAVFGGASMGALRAAELSGHGVVGIGRIHAWYRDGLLRGDDEVALLHAGAELAFRPLTLPLVQVRYAAGIAVERGLLAPRSAGALVAAAGQVHYADRTWRKVLDAAAHRLRPGELDAVRGVLASGIPDLKSEDARATLRAAAEFQRARAAPPPGPGPGRAEGRARPLSSLVRRRKLEGGLSLVAGRAVPSRDVLVALAGGRAARERSDDGLRRLLLAALARSLGLTAAPDERAAAERGWLARAGVRPGRLLTESFLSASALDGADAARLADDLALERKLLDLAARVVPDGPSALEGLAFSARLDGAWAATAAALAAGRRPPDGLSPRVMSKRKRPAPATPAAPAAPFNDAFRDLADRVGLEPARAAAATGPDAAAPGESGEAPPPRAVVRIERKGRGGKEVTVVEKLDLPPAALARWLKDLKAALGCGGAVEGGALALQGDLRERVKTLLERRGVRRVTLG